ncbi:MAG: hypothetical protein AAF668_05620 [Pseudomonadota bacterium]
MENNNRLIRTNCTVTVKSTYETLEAHVELDDGLLPTSGDKITVFGAPIQIDYGETIQIRRPAHLERGTLFDKLKVRIAAFFELTELYEVSFSDGRIA